METRANYALVGLFTLGVIAAAFFFVYWFSGQRGANQRVTYNVVFKGSVSGLSSGSWVTFNGIRIGEVKSISFDEQDPQKVIAKIEVNQSTQLREDTKARLDVQIVSGVGAIALVGGTVGSPVIKPCPHPTCTITAEPSDFQDLLATARSAGRNANEALMKISELVEQNRKPINDAIQNISKFSQALGDNAGGVDKLLVNVGSAASKVEALAADLDAIAREIKPKEITDIVANANKFMAALGNASPSVETSLKNVASITAKFDRAANQIEGVLSAAQGFLNSPDGKGAFQQIAAAAKSIRTLADNLDKRTAEITLGINRFTGAGLREFQALAVDGQRTLGELNRTLRGVDRNPQQFIFGGKPPIPEYNQR